MPNFIKIGGTWTSWQYGEMYTSCTFYIYFFTDFLERSTEKVTQQFQALNGLKFVLFLSSANYKVACKGWQCIIVI